MATLSNYSDEMSAPSNQVDNSVVEAIVTLKHFCKQMGVKLEFVKTSGPTGFKSIYGVDFRDYIYEDEADYWRHAPVNDLANTSPDTNNSSSNPPKSSQGDTT